jgi:hypothetical protein
MSIFGEWKTATIALNGTVSAAVDLGRDWEYLNINIPTQDSANISLQVSDLLGGTYKALGLSTNVFAAATGNLTTTLVLGGYRYIKVVSSETQTAARTYYVRGYRG